MRSLIQKHYPEATTVLELACGTGSVLKQLDSDYEVTGVDLSEKMLEIAARKVPRVRLIRADMTQVALDERFDVVLCVYDSINHLLKFAQWEAMFERARAHLDDGGLFVFDVNTERRLASFVRQPAATQWFSDGNLMVMDVAEAVPARLDVRPGAIAAVVGLRAPALRLPQVAVRRPDSALA